MAATWIVAGLALVFTVFSFYWLNGRRGKLKAYEPHSFAAVWAMPTVRLRLPLVLHNTGAVPIVVQDLRLSFTGRSGTPTLSWTTTRSQLKPESSEIVSMASVFAVPGRGVKELFVEFGANVISAGTKPTDDCEVLIEARLGHRESWTQLLTFTFRAGRITSPEQYISYSNAPGDVPDP